MAALSPTWRPSTAPAGSMLLSAAATLVGLLEQAAVEADDGPGNYTHTHPKPTPAPTPKPECPGGSHKHAGWGGCRGPQRPQRAPEATP